MMTHNTHWLLSLFWSYHTSLSECVFSAGTCSQVLHCNELNDANCNCFQTRKTNKTGYRCQTKVYQCLWSVKEFFTSLKGANANSNWNITGIVVISVRRRVGWRNVLSPGHWGSVQKYQLQSYVTWLRMSWNYNSWQLYSILLQIWTKTGSRG